MEDLLIKEINNLLTLRLNKPSINYSDRLDKINKGFDIFKYNNNIVKLNHYIDLAEKLEISLDLPQDFIKEREEFNNQLNMTKEQFDKLIQEYGKYIKTK